LFARKLIEVVVFVGADFFALQGLDEANRKRTHHPQLNSQQRPKVGYLIPDSKRSDLEFPVDRKPKVQAFFFDADTAARVINAADQPFKLMCLIAAVCGLRIGEVTTLKVTSLDFKRKLLFFSLKLFEVFSRDKCFASRNSRRQSPMSIAEVCLEARARRRKPAIAQGLHRMPSKSFSRYSRLIPSSDYRCRR